CTEDGDIDVHRCDGGQNRRHDKCDEGKVQRRTLHFYLPGPDPAGKEQETKYDAGNPAKDQLRKYEAVIDVWQENQRREKRRNSQRPTRRIYLERSES